MTAKGQQELELTGAKFRRNFITLLTSDHCQERACFCTGSSETGGGQILQGRKDSCRSRRWHGKLSFSPESLCMREATNMYQRNARSHWAIPWLTHWLLKVTLCLSNRTGRVKNKPPTQAPIHWCVNFFHTFLTIGAISCCGSIPHAACWGFDFLQRLLSFSRQKLIKQLPGEYYSALISTGSQELSTYHNWFGRKIIRLATYRHTLAEYLHPFLAFSPILLLSMSEKFATLFV